MKILLADNWWEKQAQCHADKPLKTCDLAITPGAHYSDSGQRLSLMTGKIYKLCRDQHTHSLAVARKGGSGPYKAAINHAIHQAARRLGSALQE